jgi:1,4-dihydroxy-6-naphthoate synthase
LPSQESAGRDSPERPLLLAYSPCPNDTSIFYAWTHGLIPEAPPVKERLEDIETLNGLALAGAADVTKVSVSAFAHLRESYALLHSGGAMARGCGPLVVAPKGSHLRAAPGVTRASALADDLSRVRVAMPGELTTAALLAQLFAGGLRRAVFMPFDRIMPAVAAGEVDAGVVIHEGRFTYASHGLRRLIDLGEWWEESTGLPVPLGGIAVRRALDVQEQARIERAVRASVEHTRAHPHAADEYVREHAQEMDAVVRRQHIDLYVNGFTVDFGPEGEEAVKRMVEVADGLRERSGSEEAHGSRRGLFWDE